MALTTPPLEIVSIPGPSGACRRRPTEAEPPTFQVEPVPVTVTVGVPKGPESISAPPWLLSTPPLVMVSELARPKTPMP